MSHLGDGHREDFVRVLVTRMVIPRNFTSRLPMRYKIVRPSLMSSGGIPMVLSQSQIVFHRAPDSGFCRVSISGYRL